MPTAKTSEWTTHSPLVYEGTRKIITLIVRLRLLRITVIGAEHVPTSGGVLMMSNHESNLDPLLLGWATRRPLHMPGKIELFRVPILRWYIKQLGCYPVDRDGHDSASLRRSLIVLRNGYILALFPEGTRSRTGQVGPFVPTLMRLALREDSPVVPVSIKGSGRILPKGAKLPRLGSRVEIAFGAPRVFGNKLSGRPSADDLTRVTQELHDIIAELHGDSVDVESTAN